jgi:MFS family permease
MFVTLLLTFVNLGPLNAALVNVLPPDLRARGVGLHTTTIHLLGDALSPFLIGVISDSVGLRIPVLFTGLLLPLAGLVLLVGRRQLVADLIRPHRDQTSPRLIRPHRIRPHRG